MKDVADLLGRILISALFLYEAIDGIVFYQNTKNTMIEYGITKYNDTLLTTALTLLVLGSILVLIGYFARVGALMMLLYWLPFTFIVYSFWDDPIKYQRLHALYFMRNLALCGGLLLLISNGAGRFSIKRLIYVMRLPK